MKKKIIFFIPYMILSIFYTGCFTFCIYYLFKNLSKNYISNDLIFINIILGILVIIMIIKVTINIAFDYKNDLKKLKTMDQNNNLKQEKVFQEVDKKDLNQVKLNYMNCLSTGVTKEDAVINYVRKNLKDIKEISFFTNLDYELIEVSPETEYDWSFRFSLDGVSMKCAGHMDEKVFVMTWFV